MRLEDYKAGKYVRNDNFKTFILSGINYNWTSWDDGELNKLLAEANREIGELNAYSLLIPDVDIYLKMFENLEIQKSSQIEGSKTTLEENLTSKEHIAQDKEQDWEKAQKYEKALSTSKAKIKDNNRIIKKIYLQMKNSLNYINNRKPYCEKGKLRCRFKL